MIARLYTGDDGQSHFEELDMDVGPYPWRELRTATGIMFRFDEPGKFLEWHPAPRRQFVITLSGQVEIGLGDGTLRFFGAGELCSQRTRRAGDTRRAPSETCRESPSPFRWTEIGRKAAWEAGCKESDND